MKTYNNITKFTNKEIEYFIQCDYRAFCSYKNNQKGYDTMIANKDSLGNILTREQIEYFKDTKVTNDKNELIVCYHGSPNAGFRVFNPQKSKSQFGNYKFGNANVNYFTTDKASASSYTEFKYDDGTVYEVYLDIKNPYCR